MKIAFASSMNSVPWGGSEILWYETAEQLAKAGFSLAICTPPWPELPTPLRRAREEWGVQHSADRPTQQKTLRQKIFARLFRRNENSFRQGWLRQCQPQILCISNGNAFQGLGWMEAAMAEAVPFISIAQAHAEFLGPGEAEGQRLIQAFAAAKVNYFVSGANQELVEYQLGCRFSNARLIANHSRHLPTTSPLPWPEPSDQTLRLACVARLHPASKGQDLLFVALADPRWRDRNLHVSLFGAGDQEQSLRRLAEMLDISKKVHFMGHTSNPTDIWSNHHALVLPSRYEGMPLVLMEAMLAGRPVITTAVAGAPELVSHGTTGFLAEAPTAEHLLQCLEEAWEMRGDWPSIGRAAHAVAAERARVAPADQLAAALLELAG